MPCLHVVFFTIASSVAQANHCSSGAECPSEDVPNNDVSLLQSKLRMNALKYGGEDLNAGPAAQIRSGSSKENVERMEVADPPTTGLQTLFILLSDSQHYSSNLRWISDSWGKNLSSLQLLAIGDGAPEKSTRLHVEPTGCPAHTVKGACCKTGEAVVMAHQLLEKQRNLKWAYIVEDDSYVRPEAMDKQLKQVDPVGNASRGTLVALEEKNLKCHNGVALRGGLALSREALTTLVGNSPSKYLVEHMQTCDLCNMHGGASLGTLAHAHNITVFSQNWDMPKVVMPKVGMHAAMNAVFQSGFEETLTSAVTEPVMYHPLKTEGKFKFLDQLFAEQRKSVDVQGLGAHCATYNGSTVCTSNPDDMPWRHD